MKIKMRYLFWGTLLILTLWAFVIEPGFRHHIKTFEIPVKNWKNNDYKIAVLADIHTGSPFNNLNKLDQIVKMTNKANPDLILIAGDFVIHEVLGGEFISPEAMTPYLKKLSAKDGVYAVLGNHDHWLDAKLVTESIEKAGIPVLTNKALSKTNFWLVGIDDSWAGKPELQKTLNQIKDEKPILLVTHNPDLFITTPEQRRMQYDNIFSSPALSF